MNAATCIICLVPYSEELEIISLNCHHCFHRNCIKEWFKIRKDCPQCRRKVNSRQIYRVILSFETCETVKILDDYKPLMEKQRATLTDLEQQLKSKDVIIAEKEAEIQRIRNKLKRFQDTQKSENNENQVKNLLDQLKLKDTIITQSLNEVKEIEEMLLDLEAASRLDAKQKEEEIADLTLRLKLKDQLLQDLLEKPDDPKNNSSVEIKHLKDNLEETTKQVQILQEKFAQISSIVDEFKLEQVFNSFSSNFTLVTQKNVVTVDDLLS